MAVTWNGNRVAAPAGADLSLKDAHVGTLNSNGEIVQGVVADALGILRGNPKLGDTATLQHSEVAQGCIGAAVARMALLAPNGSGRLITATTGQRSKFRALEPGTVDGQLISVLIGDETVA